MQWLGAAPPGHQFSVDCLGIETLGIKSFSNPVPHVSVLRMLSIADRAKKLLVRMGTADVLRWAGSCTIKTLDHDLAFDRPNDSLQPEFMDPPVSEVVFVKYPVAFADKESIESDTSFTEGSIGVFGIGRPITPQMGVKLMQVIVGPPHDPLQHDMQLLECDRGRHDKSTPDLRFDLGERNHQNVRDLISPFRHSEAPAAAPNETVEKRG